LSTAANIEYFYIKYLYNLLILLKMAILPRIALTAGEPAGIGADIIIALAQKNMAADVVVFADPTVLMQRAAQLSLPLVLDFENTRSAHSAKRLKIKPIYTAASVQAGQLNVANAHYVLETLQQACQACQNGEFDALVTAPIQKSVINDAGISFTGHTEFLAEQTQTKQVVMMLIAHNLRVALATTHLPLSQVSAAITPAHLTAVIQILHADLQSKFGLTHPHILVCGLNPHAGEGGYLGREEIEIITPVINKLRDIGMNLTGPVPADTAFTENSLAGVDAVLTMYHDQGLPVLKQRSFGDAVNVTLGLPIIRTSVDHGTALNLAGTGQASHASLLRAIQTACDMVTAMKKFNQINY